ncbi:MAG: CRTAC1 family protein [Thermoguttaceae bacterium]
MRCLFPAGLVLVTQFALAGAAEFDLPVFTDVTEKAGISFRHSHGDVKMDNIVKATGGGAMFFDYDGDGWLDIYLCNGRWNPEVCSNRARHLRGKLRNALYRNNRDGTFTDVTERAGVSGRHFAFGCSAADFDNDGDLDLYVLNFGPNELYRNNGDGTFTDISEQSGLADPRWSLQAVWFDYDGDGLLDVYVLNYLEYDGTRIPFYAPTGFPGPLTYDGQPDALYRNNGDGTFTDVTKQAGVWNPAGRGMGVTVADLDNDGDLDIYVTNDGMANDFFRNLGQGRFREEGLLRGMAFGEAGQGVSSMGPDAGDVNRDGWLDLYIPDMDYGCLLINHRDHFEDRTTPVGLAVISGQYTGWGGLLLDYDNDGYLDVYVANGDPHKEFGEEDVLARNDGTGNFIDVAARSGPYFHQKYVGRGSTCGDFDNDGDLDLLVNNLNGPAKLLRNDGGNRNHWLTVVAKLPNKRSDALGARVSVTAGSLTQIRDLIPVRGYLSQADPRLHFGLGSAAKADRVEIRWPNGQTTLLKDVPANQFLTVVQPAK